MTVFVCKTCQKEIDNKHNKLYCNKQCSSRFRSKKYISQPLKKEKAKIKSWENPINLLLSRVKYRCKKEETPFNLIAEDIIVPEVCPILGIKLNFNRGGRRGYFENSPSLDRKIPEGGYVKGNVRIISARANLLKNNATVAELEKVLEDLRKIQSGGI